MGRWRPNLLQIGLLLLLAGGAGALLHWGPWSARPVRGYLYVSEPTLDRVSVIDLNTGKTAHHYAVGRLPHQLLSDAQGRIYVLETGSQSLSQLPAALGNHPVRQRIIGSVPDILPHRALGEQALARANSCKDCHKDAIQGSLPGSIALTRDQSQLWITELRARRLSLLAVEGLETQEQLGLLGEESSPCRILIHPTNGDLVIVSRSYKGALPGAGGVGELGLRIALDPEHAGSLGTSSVTVGDARLNTVKGRLALPWAGAGAGAFSPDGKELYLACRGGDRVAVIGLAPLRLLRSIATAPGPSAVAWVDPKTLAVASLNTNPGVLQFLDTDLGDVVHRTAVGANPAVLAFDANQRKLYVGCTGSASVAEVDVSTRRVEREFKLESHPGGLIIVAPPTLTPPL